MGNEPVDGVFVGYFLIDVAESRYIWYLKPACRFSQHAVFPNSVIDDLMIDDLLPPMTPKA